MKKKIIFIHFNKFLDNFDWIRYEFDKLEQQYDIEIHELLRINHPSFKNQDRNEGAQIKKFSDLKEWKQYLNNKKFENTVFIFQTFPYSIKSLKCYLLVKKKKIKCAIISINNLPTYNNQKVKIFFLKKIYYKLLSIIFRPKQAIFVLESIIIRKIINFFRKQLSPDFVLLGGDNNSSKTMIKKLKDYSQIIRINSWDYSNSLRPNKEIELKQKYALYVSDGEARYPSDSYLANSKRVEDPKKLCKKLCEFFEKFEKFYDLKIIIASHPRATVENNLDIELGKRLCFKGYTKELVKNSELIINAGSTSISYATIYKKPVLYIFSNSQSRKNIPGMRKVEFISRLINSERINIDNFEDFKILKLTVNNESYSEFFSRYVCIRRNKKNFEIISEELMKKI